MLDFAKRLVEKKQEFLDSIPEWEYSPDESYKSLLIKALELTVDTDKDYPCPDVSRITTIDDGNSQGTLLFVVGETGYPPSEYWFVKVSYGSCSACDTLQAVESKEDLYTLALHMLQGMKSI